VTKDLYTPNALNIVGLQEIRQIFRMNQPAITQWRVRGMLPEPNAIVSNRPIWRLETVIRWGRRTGRTMFLSQELEDKYPYFGFGKESEDV
jgi:hypothetical protein